jgi:alginate O-acetyltransferase complex protein AlgJ
VRVRAGPERDVERTVELPRLPHESWLPSEHPLHRPRHGPRQLTALLCAAVFFVVPALTLVVGAQPGEFENHRLAAFPSPLDGWGLFTEAPGWAVDHLPFREAAVRGVDRISRGVFGEPSPFDQRQAGLPAPPFAPPAQAGPSTEHATATPGLAEPPIAAGFPKVIEGKDGWLYYGYDVQGKCRPVRSMDEIIANLVRLRAAVESSGRTFILVVPPDKTTAVPQHLPDTFVGKSCAAEASREFWRRVRTEAGALDLLTSVGQASRADGQPPYYQLDTHWDDHGALAMVRQVAEDIQPGTTAGWVSRPERVAQAPADLPKLLGRDGQNVGQLYSLAPDGGRDRTRQPLGDLRRPVHLQSTPGPGMITRPVGVLADSFLLPATRYLPAAFADIDMVYNTTLADAPQDVLQVMVRSDIVVVESIERNLASGSATVLDPAVIDLIAAELAAHPRHR